MRCPPNLRVVVPIAILLFWLALRIAGWWVHYDIALQRDGEEIARAEAWRETWSVGLIGLVLGTGLWAALHFLVIRRFDYLMQKASEATAAAARELEAKNKELETIVYVVSHDLRAPLLNVQGFGAALARTCGDLKEKLQSGDTADVQRLIETDLPRSLRFIEAGIAKMDSLLRASLRFSRLGRVELHIEALDMNKIVFGAAQALRFQTEEAGATVKIGDLPECLGDATLVGQVFSNLIDNALKYREPSRPCEISISGAVIDGETQYTVRDNGMGIAADHQPKVFELFHRLHPRKNQGEGLGLTIAQRAIERQHGRIWLESEAGQGTAFHVALPALRPQA